MVRLAYIVIVAGKTVNYALLGQVSDNLLHSMYFVYFEKKCSLFWQVFNVNDPKKTCQLINDRSSSNKKEHN